jgi:serine O-acetyltransferase
LSHTNGLVLAKASYADYCVFHQCCTVGRDGDKRPRLGKGTVLYPGAAVIGDCTIGENTVISPGVVLVNASTPGNCILVESKGGRPRFKEAKEYYADRYFVRT